MGSLDLGRQTTDGIVRAGLWEGRECANCSCGHIRISADRSVRAVCLWDSRCANGSYVLMAGSVDM